MTYNYQIGPGDAFNLWQIDQISAEPFESPVATFDAEDRYRWIATEAIDMKTIAKIVYPVREAFLKEDFISSASYTHREFNQIYLPGANRKVDFSNFSHDPKVLSIFGRSYVYCEEACTVEMELITCGGVKLWLNGSEVLLYKSYERNVPNNHPFTLHLEKGDNELFLYVNDLAERDVFFYFELINRSQHTLEAYVPLVQDQKSVEEANEVIGSIYLEKDTYVGQPIVLRYDHTLLKEDRTILWGYDEVPALLSMNHDRLVIGDASDPSDTYFGKTESNYFPIKTEVDGLKIGTTLYLATYNQRLLDIIPCESMEGRKRQALEVAAKEANKGEIGTALAILAHENQCSSLCREIIEMHLTRIEERLDCADFRLPVILLMVKKHGDLLPEDLKARIRVAALNFRYWCDEPGNDVMWFFSENHALLFHVSQYLAGDLYTDAQFVSGKSSEEVKAQGYERIVRWFHEFLPKGYDEWNSLTYLPVDCIAFFTLYATAPDEEIKALAQRGLDDTFEIIAANLHHKIYASSYGRTYEHTLKGLELGELSMYAWMAWNQGTINVKNHAASLFAVSDYRPNDYRDLRDLTNNVAITVERIQGCHGACTYMYKTNDYALASAMKFHPFESGLQQHFINVSFSEDELPIWFNHPGEMVFSGHNRPSYWAGWQTIPYIEQYNNVIIAGIRMHAADEVDFIHGCIPLNQLDEYEGVGHWFLFRKGNAYGALWFANGYELTKKGANTDKEIISRGRENGFILQCGSATEFECYSAFKETILGANVNYESPEKIIYETSIHGRLVTDFSQGMSLNGVIIERKGS